MSILTPESHPDHHTVGQYYKAHGCLYYCDSYDTQMGYWMTPVFGDAHSFTQKPPERTNVSERAINRTFHEIYDVGTPDDPHYGCRHRLSKEEREYVLSVLSLPKSVEATAAMP